MTADFEKPRRLSLNLYMYIFVSFSSRGPSVGAATSRIGCAMSHRGRREEAARHPRPRR